MLGMDIRALLQISRPRFWLYTVGPVLLALAATVNSISDTRMAPLIIWLCLFFLFPANIWLYGINDWFDRDTDIFNEKKGDQEHLLLDSDLQWLRRALIASFLLVIATLFFLPPVAQFLLILHIFLGYAYSAPPFRFKARPFLDSYSNVLYILPGVLVFWLQTNTLPSMRVLLAGLVWTAGMHAFSAIPDIVPDKEAGLRTIATALGYQRTLIFVFFHWLLFSLLIMTEGGLFWFLGVIYPTIAGWSLWCTRREVIRFYWFMPWLNAILGMAAFFLLLFIQYFPVTLP